MKPAGPPHYLAFRCALCLAVLGAVVATIWGTLRPGALLPLLVALGLA